jgi:hypothetical protein
MEQLSKGEVAQDPKVQQELRLLTATILAGLYANQHSLIDGEIGDFDDYLLKIAGVMAARIIQLHF